MLNSPQGGKWARGVTFAPNIEFGDCGQVGRRDMIRIGDVAFFLQNPGEYGIEVGSNNLHRNGVILLAAGESQGGKEGQEVEMFHMPVFLWGKRCLMPGLLVGGAGMLWERE